MNKLYLVYYNKMSLPPSFNTNIFNNNAFQSSTLTLQQANARYQQLGRQFVFSSSLENFLGSSAISPTNYGINLNHTLNNANTVYQSNAISFSRNNIVGSAIALQRDINNDNQISFFLNTAGTMEARYRFNRLSFESQSMIISESTRNINSTSVSGLFYNTNTAPNWLQRIQTSNRFTMLGHITSSVLVDAVSYDIPSTSLITFNLQANQLRLNTSTETAQISLIADGGVQDGATYDRVLRFIGRGVPILTDFKILLDNRGDSVSNVRPAWIGTTNSELRIGSNDISRLVLTRDGYIGVHTNSPICALDVGNIAGSSFTVDPSGQGYSRLLRTGVTTATGPIVISPLCARFQGDLACSSIYTSSDRRLKNDIKDLHIDIEKYIKFKPVSYKFNNNNNKECKGLIAQDIMDLMPELVFVSENKDMKIQDENIDLDGYQYNINYQEIIIMNLQIIQQLIKRINNLETKITTAM